MISKTYLRLVKNPARKYSKIVQVNGKEFKMPAGFEEPQYDMDHIQNSSKVLLVRHANTLFNLAYVKMLHEKGFGKEVCEFLQDESYRDTPLSEFGIEQ